MTCTLKLGVGRVAQAISLAISLCSCPKPAPPECPPVDDADSTVPLEARGKCPDAGPVKDAAPPVDPFADPFAAACAKLASLPSCAKAGADPTCARVLQHIVDSGLTPIDLQCIIAAGSAEDARKCGDAIARSCP